MATASGKFTVQGLSPLSTVKTWLNTPLNILPLIIFRIGFGVLMFSSTVRFIVRGWVSEFYLVPQVHFTYLGFGWVRPLPSAWMYAVVGLIALFSLLVALGLFYRVSITGFFLLFTYVELIDKTYYLNHYYFISLLSFLLIFLPLHRAFSLDVRLGLVEKASHTPAWTIYAVRAQLALVYLFAGIAKLEPDWLFRVMPLQTWLRTNTDLPLIGPLFDYSWVAFAMSWAGLLFDLSIPFLLLWWRTRPLAYLAVVAFHVFTALLFPIGMFPWIMMTATLIFFSEKDYRRVARWLNLSSPNTRAPPHRTAHPNNLFTITLLTLFFTFQLVTPLRHLAYPGNPLWTEEGFRFSWRVMLVDKSGTAFFTVLDESTGKLWEVFPSDYLTPQQERQMAYQPDMILQFAHFLEDEFIAQGYEDVAVYAESFVSMNGRASRPFVDSTVDLTEKRYSLAAKDWLLEQ